MESRPAPHVFFRGLTRHLHIALGFALLGSTAAGYAQAPAGASDDLPRLVAAGEDARALALLDRLPPSVRHRPGLSYLRGRLLDRLHRFSEAAASYPTGDDAAGLPDAIRADSRRRRGTALARGGDCETALALFGDDDDPVIEARAAQCQLALGNAGLAINALRRVVDRGDAAVDLFAARLALSDAHLAAGQLGEAVGVLSRLIVDRPAHPEIRRAEESLERAQGHPIRWTPEQRMQRAERLIALRRHAEALEELDALPALDGMSARRRALHLRGTALYRARRRYEEAASVLAASARLGGEHAAEDAFHAARALSRADHDEDAVRAYRAFARSYPRHRRAAEARYLAAWLEMRHQMPGGVRNMRRFARSRDGRRGRWYAEATWHLALSDFEAGRFRDAERGFEAYAATGSSAMVRGRGQYWASRAREARGDRSGAIRGYRGVLTVEALHWYALLARQRLEGLQESAGSPFSDGPAATHDPGPAAELPAAARFFTELGLFSDAVGVLRRRERELGRTRWLAETYRALHAPSRLVRLFGGPSTVGRRATPGPADRWRWEAAFPRPWPQEVSAASTASSLRPAHVYAVMRQESGFNPNAVSFADAIGLMQLLPSTAERLAGAMGVAFRRELLFDPAMNVRLGTRYVGDLVRRFGVPLAFAAYNAGEHRVEAWLEDSGETDLDLFVEHIPFRQTRNYVRRVTGHFAHYRYLAEPDAGWPLTLPARVGP